jgi:cell division septation protein DedD
MSKLDFITILIVAICVAALGFLVFKTVRLMNPDEDTPEVIENPVTTPDEADDYPLDDEGEVISDDATNPDGESADDGAAIEDDPSDDEYPVAGDDTSVDKEDTPKESEPTTYDGGSSSGAYLVLAGSYKQKVNATNQVNKLKNKGFNNAEVEIFNGGALAVALVDRFDSYSKAAALKKDLEAKGFSVFIKKK